MSRINTNVASLTAQRVLFNNNSGLNQSLERLSTGLRINRGKDDPAGLIASENLRAEISSTNAAINNAERAERVVNIAEGGLSEVSNLLTELQGLITTTANAAGLSSAEKEANQLQIDSILQTIDRVAGQTSFQGNKLLNGNFDFRVSSQAAGIDDLRVNGAKFEGSSLDVNVLVTQSAQNAGLFLSLGGDLDLGTTGSVDPNDPTSTFVIEVGGSLGSREFSFASGTSLGQIADTINTFSDIIGVSAATSGTGVVLASTEFGGDEFVNIKVVDDAGQAGGVVSLEADDFGSADAATNVAFTATQATNGIRDAGQDVGATINGIVATTNGKTARVDSDFLNLSITLEDAESQAPGLVDNGGGTTFSIAGGGATFQLGGNVDIGSKVTLGISEVAIRNLGSNAAGGFLDDIGSGKAFNVVDGDLSTAQQIVSEAIEQVSTTRGRLGAFQRNTLGATLRSLSVSFENTSAAESVIRDTDFASETAALTRSQILSQAATNTLALANQQPQNALQLLG